MTIMDRIAEEPKRGGTMTEIAEAQALTLAKKRLDKSVPAVRELLPVKTRWGCPEMAYVSLTLPFDYFRKVMAALDADPAVVEEYLTALSALEARL
jgi:hypothetical protein